MPPAVGIARLCANHIDGVVIDERDGNATEISALGVQVCVAQTLMRQYRESLQLAHTALEFASRLAASASVMRRQHSGARR